MNYWKNSLSCWCFVFDVLHRLLAFCLIMSYFFVLQVFIPIYRGFERRWEFSRYINLSCLKLWFFTIDLFPDLILVLWRTNFKSIPFPKEQRLLQYSCYSCLDMETSCREGGCRDKCRVSGRTLRTLSFVNSGEGASDEICFWWPCFWWCVFRSSSSDPFLQTQFFRRILPDALSFN